MGYHLQNMKTIGACLLEIQFFEGNLDEKMVALFLFGGSKVSLADSFENCTIYHLKDGPKIYRLADLWVMIYRPSKIDMFRNSSFFSHLNFVYTTYMLLIRFSSEKML